MIDNTMFHVKHCIIVLKKIFKCYNIIRKENMYDVPNFV